MKLLIFLLFTIQIASAQQSCEEGFATNPQTGRCVKTEADNFDETIDPDEINRLAKEKANEVSTTTNETKDKRGVGKVIVEDIIPTAGALAIGIPSTTIAITCPLSTSSAALSAGAVSAIAAEIKSVIEYKKKQKKLEERMSKIREVYKSINEPTIDQRKAFTAETQAEAFEIIAQAEDAVAKAAGSKKAYHTIAASFYGIAAIAAGVEVAASVVPGMAATYNCPAAGISSSASIAGMNLTQTLGSLTMGVLGPVLSAASAPVAGALMTPAGRIIIASTAASYSGILASSAGKQQERARKRASDIRELKMKFLAEANGEHFNDCKPEDRIKPSNVSCYCYNDDWSKNSARSESQVCNQHWGKSYAPEETNYNDFLAANGSNQSCVTKDYKDDPRCNCRNTNSCLSLPTGNFNLQGFSGIKTVSRSNAEIANRYFQGKLEEGDLGKLEKGNAAFSNKKLLDSLAKNSQTKELSNKIALNQKKFEEGMGNQITSSARSAGANANSLANNIKSPFASDLSKELKKTTLKQEAIVVKSNQRPLNKNSISAPNLDLDFSSLGSGNSKSGSVEVLSEAPSSETNYDSFESPVNADNGQSIFKVITHRYHQTGIKKLFAKRKRIKAE